MSEGENDSDIIDRDVDDVLAISDRASMSETPEKNEDKGHLVDHSVLNSVKISLEKQKPCELSSSLQQIQPSSSSNGSYAVDGIAQIDVLDRRHIRIHHHGTIALGTVCSINDLILDDTITSSHIPINGLDLLQLLACQPIHALDVQPLTDEIDESINNSHIFPVQYSIHFITVPDGALGVEVTHITLQQAMNVPPDSSINNTSFIQGNGFRIDRYSCSAAYNADSPAATSLLSVGDIIIAVNDTSIVLMPAPTAAAILAQTKNRRFTILRITTKKENADAKEYFINRNSTPEGRKRYRSYLREETYKKYGQKQPNQVVMEDKSVETDIHINMKNRNSSDTNNTTENITRVIRRETEDIIDAHEENAESTNEPLHKRWCAVRRTFLCHTLYKPVSDLYPAVLRQETYINTHPASEKLYNTNNNVNKEYAEALHRQKFLEVIYAKDGSRELKNTLMRKFRRLEN